MAPSFSSTGSTSSTLIERVKAHDPEAWRRLVKLYTPLVEYWCRRSSLGPEDTADILQEVFRAVFLGIRSFRRDRPEDSFRGWLRKITKHKITDLVRRQGVVSEAAGGSEAHRRLLDALADDLGSRDRSSAMNETKRLFERALELIQSEFEEKTWQAFLLLVVEQLSPADVAKELGMTVGAVYMAKSRILSRIRSELGDLIE